LAEYWQTCIYCLTVITRCLNLYWMQWVLRCNGLQFCCTRWRDAEDVWLHSTEVSEIFLSLKAGSDWKRLFCQRASEEATLSYSLACLNQHNLLCLGVIHDPTAVERLLSLILLSLWIVFIVYIRVAVECTGRFTHRGGLDVFRHQCLRCRRHLPSPRNTTPNIWDAVVREIPDLGQWHWATCYQTFQPTPDIQYRPHTALRRRGWLLDSYNR